MRNLWLYRVALLSPLIAASVSAQSGATSDLSACARVVVTPRPRFSLTPESGAPVYEAGERCIPSWADSLRSTNPNYAGAARNALVLIGGRAAVDALRADAERDPSRTTTWAALMGMASTGSAADLAFVVRHLQAPVPETPANQWVEFEAAVTTLGLLHAESARDSLKTALTRTRQGTFAARAVETALSALDRPPCADSLSTDPRAFINVVLRCRPASMWVGNRYDDSQSGGVWAFVDSAWTLTARTPADTGKMARVSFASMVAADGSHAEVTVSTWCGMLCGEGWTFRLMRTGGVWRIVNAFMNWVS